MEEVKLLQCQLCDLCQSLTRHSLEKKIDNLIKLIKDLADKYKIDNYEELILEAMDVS